MGVLDMVLRDVTRWARGLHAAPAWPTAFHHLAQISHPIIRRSAGIDRVEAAVYADQPETARLSIDDLETFAAATGQPWAAAMAAHGRAVLAVSGDGDDRGRGSSRPSRCTPTRPARSSGRGRSSRTASTCGVSGGESTPACTCGPPSRPSRTSRHCPGPIVRPRSAGLGRECTQARPGNGRSSSTPTELHGRASCVQPGPVQPRGRRPALREPPHRRLPPAQRLHQARHRLPWRARPVVADVTRGLFPGSVQVAVATATAAGRLRHEGRRRAVRTGERRPRRTHPGGRRPARPGWWCRRRPGGEPGDAERGADLVAGHHHARGDTGCALGDLAHRAHRDGHEHRTDPEADEEEAGQHVGGVRRVRAGRARRRVRPRRRRPDPARSASGGRHGRSGGRRPPR